MRKISYIVFILAIMVLCGRISESSAAAGYSQWVNPAYKNLFKEKPLSFFAQTQRAGAAECHSSDEIVSALRENFENRVADFSIRMIYNFRFDEVKDILNQAYDRVISEDDYLHWNMVGWQYSSSGRDGDVTVYYSASYLTTYEQEQYISQRVSEILPEIISEGMNDEQKEKAVHDWVVLHVKYDLTYREHSAYAALFLGEVVCQGYSLLTFKMLKEVGITGRIVYSDSMGHAWNMIYLCGSWYHLDVTWDDPVPDVEGRVLYTFYNRSDAEIQSGDNPHCGWDTSKFPQAPVSYEEGVCAIPINSPSVVTTSISSITQIEAVSGGNVTSDGGASVTAKGVCWSTSPNPTTANSKTNDGTGTGIFTSSLSGLTANTTYYVRAYATNSAGTAYGNQVSFTTPQALSVPTVTTSAVSTITQTTAASGGNVISDGGASVTAKGVCWSTAQTPTTANSKTADGTGTGSFTSSLSGLTANTTYYVRAYATNSAGTAYGNQVWFTTPQPATLTDVMIGLQILAGIDINPAGTNADADKNGKTELKDVLINLRSVAGMQ